MAAKSPPPRLLDPRRHGWAAARVALLTVLGGLSEGIGVMLLVPLLGLLGPDHSGHGAPWLEALGLPLRLEILLTLLVVLIVGRAVIVQGRSLAAQRFENALVDGLRLRTWEALIHCDWRALQGLERAGTVNLLAARLDQVGHHVSQLFQAGAMLATLGALGIAALAISPRLAAGLVLAAGAVLLGYHLMRREAAGLGARFGKAHSAIHDELDQGLGALRLIKGLGREDLAIDRLDREVGAMRGYQLAWLAGAGRGQITLQGAGAALLALLVWLALTRWHLAIATVLPMIAIAARALPLLGSLQQCLLGAAHSRPALDETLALLARAEAAREAGNPTIEPPVLAKALRLEQVTVHFPGAAQPALEGIDLEVPARGIIAITGPSGAGKSTLADLLGGLIGPDRGRITVDGTELTGPARRAWRRRVAYVQQEPVLFAATLRENLLWAAPDADHARLRAALVDAGADFAFDLPQGLDTRIGEGGRALSGGERQRLMLARALLGDPALLILDEAASALDPASESRIAEAIDRLRGRMAIVVIGHRGALLALADRVVELDRGKVVSGGPG